MYSSYFYSIIYTPGPLPISSIFNLQRVSLNCAEAINLGPFEDLGQQCNNNILYKLNILEIRFPFDLQHGTSTAYVRAHRRAHILLNPPRYCSPATDNGHQRDPSWT